MYKVSKVTVKRAHINRHLSCMLYSVVRIQVLIDVYALKTFYHEIKKKAWSTQTVLILI